MKIKMILLITIFSVVGLLSAKEKQEQKSWEYYDAERVKVIMTHQLTTEGGYSRVRWSPDSEKISADLAGRGLQIFELEENGKKIESIGEISELTDKHYAWSPDGDSIVYSLYEGGEWYSLWIAKIGKKSKKLEIIGKERLTSEGGLYPDWSPDGKKIIFTFREGLGIIDSDGTNRKILLEGEEIWYPQFIDEDEIIYLKGSTKIEIKPRMFRPRETRRLFKFNLKTEEEISLFPEKIITEFKVIIPTKHKRTKYKSKIYCDVKDEVDFIINLDMTEKYELPVDSWVEDFSPDGSKFVYIKGEADWKGDDIIASEIYVMNSNGKGLNQLTDTPDIIEDDVKWSPDGKWLLYVNHKNNSIYISKLTRHHD